MLLWPKLPRASLLSIHASECKNCLSGWTRCLPRPCRSEVEKYYEQLGYLLPAYHGGYWIGLQAQPPWNPAGFRWIDKSIPDISNGNRGWGTYRGTVSKPEPDNRFTNELCAIGNYTERIGSPGMEYYGWDDKQCGRKFPFMCRIIRECPQHQACLRRVKCPLVLLLLGAVVTTPSNHSLTQDVLVPSAAAGIFRYTDEESGNTYVLNTNLLNQADAQKACNAEGGHLASWSDMDQQGSVEATFTEMVRPGLRCTGAPAWPAPTRTCAATSLCK